MPENEWRMLILLRLPVYLQEIYGDLDRFPEYKSVADKLINQYRDPKALKKSVQILQNFEQRSGETCKAYFHRLS